MSRLSFPIGWTPESMRIVDYEVVPREVKDRKGNEYYNPEVYFSLRARDKDVTHKKELIESWDDAYLKSPVMYSVYTLAERRRAHSVLYYGMAKIMARMT